MKIVRQEGENECGISCLKMILDYFHLDPGIGEIKKYSGYLLSGTTMSGIKECLAHYHIEAKGYDASLKAITDEFHYPCILLTDHQGYFHFIVLEKIQKNYFYLNDPALGRRKMTFGELSAIYLGKVILIKSVGDNPHTSISLNVFLIDYVVRHNKSFGISFLLTLLVSAFSLGKDYFLYHLLEQYTLSTLRAFLITSGIYFLFQKAYYRHMITISQRGEKEIVYDSYQNLLKCRGSFFYSHTKEEVLSKIESLEELSTYIVQLSMSLLYSFFIVVMVGGILFYFHIQLFLIYLFFSVVLAALVIAATHIIQIQQEKVLSEKGLLLGKIKRILYHLNSYRIAFKANLNSNPYFEKMSSCFKQQSNIELLISMLICIFLIFFIWAACCLSIPKSRLFIAFLMIGKGNEALNTILNMIISYPRMKILYERMQEVSVKESGEPFEETITSIHFDKISYAYGCSLELYHKFSFSFTGHYLIQGGNGTGKSTLLSLIHGDDSSYLGNIYYNLRELKTISRASIDRRVVYVESEMTFDEAHILSLIDERWLRRALQDHAAVLEEMMKWNLFDLSAGKRQFTAFLYVLFLDFDVYLLDECFNHMDEMFLGIVRELLVSSALMNKIILCVEHNFKEISGYEVICLDQREN